MLEAGRSGSEINGGKVVIVVNVEGMVGSGRGWCGRVDELEDVKEELTQFKGDERDGVVLETLERGDDVTEWNTDGGVVARDVRVEDDVRVEEGLTCGRFPAKGLELEPMSVVLVASDAGNSVAKDVAEEGVLEVELFLGAALDEVVGETGDLVEEGLVAVDG